MTRLAGGALVVVAVWALGACGAQSTPRPIEPCGDGGCDVCIGCP